LEDDGVAGSGMAWGRQLRRLGKGTCSRRGAPRTTATMCARRLDQGHRRLRVGENSGVCGGLNKCHHQLRDYDDACGGSTEVVAGSRSETTAQGLQGGLDDDVGSRNVNDDIGSEEIFSV
jgi:hypothetical protein